MLIWLNPLLFGGDSYLNIGMDPPTPGFSLGSPYFIY